MKTYQRNFNNGRFARRDVLSRRQREEDFKGRIIAGAIVALVIVFIGFLLWQGAVYSIIQAEAMWGRIEGNQKELYYEAKRISTEYVPILPQIAHAEKEDVEALKAEVVERLRVLESGGINPKEGEVFYTHDSPKSLRNSCTRIGGKRNLECESWGVLQVKIPTLMLWGEQLGTPMTELEALNLALDDEKIQKFVGNVLVEIKGSCYQWTSCVREKAWFSTRIEKIRGIMK